MENYPKCNYSPYNFRERHAKTLEIAQEEVLTCLGICVAERLNLIYRRLREEEIIIKILAAVAVDALSRHFHVRIFWFNHHFRVFGAYKSKNIYGA